MKWTLFYVVVSLQALFLIGMSASYYAMDRWGETIYLETEPIDPRDPFYGDYVTLRYDIESFPAELWQGSEDPERGDMVFVTVEEGEDGKYEVVQAAPASSATEEGQVELKAKYDWSDMSQNNLHVNIGLDRYFIEEDTGDSFEQVESRVVEIVVAPWGQKKITSID
ncbi:hypothetical protein GCM10010954_12930 [Halobacillus andaensis]|uniref:GDYXXLXY domain-containing protein n=1 Tax=Halobacillus andaensis TaxID=1176239 RepID=A0A917B3B7_HALAA|nr:GDYXXLXY domain-containing protein [Halobacillus andaensis]MBP2004089.1 putative membrane-anchored protein [Halobacillus andaensis]GGF15707.1 hypothetical protein GCM10010954_12930 [Halobacillus andaensis]